MSQIATVFLSVSQKLQQLLNFLVILFVLCCFVVIRLWLFYKKLLCLFNYCQTVFMKYYVFFSFYKWQTYLRLQSRKRASEMMRVYLSCKNKLFSISLCYFRKVGLEFWCIMCWCVAWDDALIDELILLNNCVVFVLESFCSF